MKLKALALVAMMIAAPAFAADYVTDVTQTGVDIAGTEVVAAYAGYAIGTADVYSTNVALIEQLDVTAASIAVIDQSAAVTADNFAAISQTTANPSVAFISQVGAANFAYIKQ